MGRRGGGGKRLLTKVKQDLATIINYRLSDPRLKLVSITRVELFQDNLFANVHYSVLGEAAEQRKVQRALEDARGRIQGLLGRSLKTRNTPKLTFVYDPGLAAGARVGAILTQLQREWAERDGASSEGADADGADDDAEAGGDELDGADPEDSEDPEEDAAAELSGPADEPDPTSEDGVAGAGRRSAEGGA